MTSSPAATLTASSSRAQAATDRTLVQPRRPADHAPLFAGEPRPTRLGNYVIIRRIGGGAMGDVYLGHHEELDRQAAIKLVRPAAEDNTIERQRLLREARVLARIDHPNVIAVHDSGTHDNRVYLAMEYVKGTTLGEWQKTRPWRPVLDAYLAAGRGLHAVHSVVLGDDSDPNAAPRGLCHRDFKPDNVLVSDAGEVRVADFGLAVPTRRPAADAAVVRPLDIRLTADCSVVGTPLYISPEQLAGSPGDARSDQYSFCVALYEALYAQHPFYAPAPATRDSELATASGGPGRTSPHFALFEAILTAPLRPAPARSPVPRRIHAILARGLQRDPADRHASMTDLLAALARGPTRRPLQALAAGLAVAAAFAVGMAANQRPAMCSNLERETAGLWSPARQAEVHAAFLTTGARHADSSFAAVDRGLTTYLARWTAARQAACDAAYRDGSQPLATQQRSMACLAQQLDTVRDLVTDLAAADTVTTASARDRVAALTDPNHCDARHLYARGCDLEVPGDPAVARVRPQIEAAQAAELAGRLLVGETLAARAVAAARAADLPALVVDAEFTRARILTELGRPLPARDALLAARDLAEASGCDVATIDIDAYTAKLVALHPELDAGLGDHAIHTGRARLARPGHDDPARLAQLHNDSGLLRAHRHHDDAAAEADYLTALELRRQHGLADTPAQARTQQNLGLLLRSAGRHPEAVAALDDALTLYRATYGDEHPALWRPHFNLGLTHLDAGELAAADTHLNRALVLAAAAHGERSPHLRLLHVALAKLAYSRHDGRAAEAHALAGLATCERPGDPHCIDLARQHAHARDLQHDPAGALQIRRRALADSRRPEPELVDQRTDLAGSLLALGRPAEAYEQLRLAAANQGDAGDRDDPDLALYTGEALLALHAPERAIPAFERARVIADTQVDARAAATWGLARSWCAAARDPAEARALAREARTTFTTAVDDPEADARVADIDLWLHTPCPPRPE